MLGLKKKGAKKAPTTQGPATRKMFNIRVGGAANAAVAATTDVTASPGVGPTGMNDKGYDLEAGDSKAADGDADPPADGEGTTTKRTRRRRSKRPRGMQRAGSSPCTTTAWK